MCEKESKNNNNQNTMNELKDQKVNNDHEERREKYELEMLLRRPSLRKNIRKRSSQVYREMELTEETTCGIGCIKGEWLQSFANKKAFVFIYGILGCIYGSYYAYFNGTITTLEKRFKIPSRTMGIIATGSDMLQIFVSPIFSYYTGKGHRPRWVGLGIYTVVLSTIISALPHFLYGAGEDVLDFTVEYGINGEHLNQTNEMFATTQLRKQLCKNESEECQTEEAEGMTPTILLFTTQIIHGFGGCLYYTVGTAYMDDNIKKSKTPALMSLSYILKMLGPAFGYWLSSMCLKIFVSPGLTPTIDESDPRWVGAWWIGNLVIGLLLLILASLLMLFPKTLPRAAARKVIADERRGKNISAQDGSATYQDMIDTFKRLLKNPTFNFNNFAGVFYVLGFMAYWIFLPKYIETQYRHSASTANFVTGTVTLIFSSIGILIAGGVITKYRPRARYLAGWNVLVAIFMTLGLISYAFLGCESNDEQSLLMSTHFSSNATCKPDCNCDYTLYSPVCSELKQTFISACHAGCRNTYQVDGTKVYTDCECVPISVNETTIFGKATDGACTLDCQSNFIIFVIIVCIVNFIGATGRCSNFLVQLRCVEERDKAVSLGFGFALLSLFGFVPSPILFGYILDTTCLFWGKTCEGTGNCWLYDSKKLRFVMNFTAVGFVSIGTLFDIGVWYFVKDLKIFDDDNKQEDEDDDDDDFI